VIWVFGQKLYGRVYVVDGTFVVTQFFHVWYLPLIPVGSHVVLERDVHGACETLSIPLSGVSVLAGYTRVWSIIAMVACAIAALSGDWAALLALPILAAGSAYAFLRLGRPTETEAAMWRVYARHAHVPFDVALLDRTRAEALRAQVARDMEPALPALAAGTYRELAIGPEGWVRAAEDPTVQDDAWLGLALTRARLEESLATKREARSRMRDLHDRVWAKLASRVAPAA
jgi:hypothetical protein